MRRCGGPAPGARACRCGQSDILVELVEYHEPARRARPAGYLITGQGILNVAFGSLARRDFDALHDRLSALGYRANSEPWTVPDVASVVYFTNDQGFSVEFLHVEPGGLDHMGFAAGEAE